MLRKRKNSNMWYWQAQINGKKITRSTGETNKRLAEKVVREQFEPWVQMLRQQPAESFRLSHAIIRETERVRNDISESRARRVEYALLKFIEFAGDISIEQITTPLLDRYQLHRIAAGIATETIKTELYTIARLLRENNLTIQRPKTRRGRQTPNRPFTRDELVRFFAACPERWHMLFLFLLVTGARLGDITPSSHSTHTGLLKTEIDLDGRRATIRQSKAKPSETPPIRHVALPEPLIEPLRAHLDATPGPFAFLKPWKPARTFDTILHNAKIPKTDLLGQKLTIHSFRHTHATELSAILNAIALQQHLGHKRVDTTAIYVTSSIAPVIPINLGPLLSTQNPGPDGVIKRCQEEKKPLEESG